MSEKKCFFGFEELGNNQGIQYFYQFIDSATKKELYYQDYQKIDTQYFYNPNLESTYFVVEKEDIRMTNKEPGKSAIYIEFTPVTQDSNIVINEDKTLIGIGQNYIIYINSKNATFQAGIISEKKDFFEQNNFLKNRIWGQIFW